MLGNRVRVQILRYLAEAGPSLRAAIEHATELSAPTLGYHLSALEDLGAISGNIPIGEKRGRPAPLHGTHHPCQELSKGT
ncbi:winged helix-turn-helix domain-containing protein [Arthrobacter sp. SF27]|uniref:winged helix-turn-helix domain-containing protein n=1 Tax=Crystallibacter degradans TaxID=2726743 RepID=UPI00147591E4|nr:helix-turn-helix transcriptional regulator [Arthrobacter sp. SF27]